MGPASGCASVLASLRAVNGVTGVIVAPIANAFVSDQHAISRILEPLGLRSPELDRPPPVGEIRGITRVAEAGEG